MLLRCPGSGGHSISPPLPELGEQKALQEKTLDLRPQLLFFRLPLSSHPSRGQSWTHYKLHKASEKGQCLEGPYCWVEHRLDLALVPRTLFLSRPLGEDFRVPCGRGQPLPMMSQMSQ